MQKKLHFNSFIAASIAIFIPIFIWGNTVSHFPWIIEKLDFTNSTIGFLLMYFSIVQLIASQTAGRLIIPAIGTRNTLIIGIIIFSISPITFGLSNSKTLFLLSCFLQVLVLEWFNYYNNYNKKCRREDRFNITNIFKCFSYLRISSGALCSGIYRHLSFDSHYLFFTLIFIALGSTFFIFYFGLKPNLEENNEIEKIKIPEKNILILWTIYVHFYGNSHGAS